MHSLALFFKPSTTPFEIRPVALHQFKISGLPRRHIPPIFFISSMRAPRGCAPNIEELARADTRGVLSQLLHKQIGANMFKVMAESLL